MTNTNKLEENTLDQKELYRTDSNSFEKYPFASPQKETEINQIYIDLSKEIPNYFF